MIIVVNTIAPAGSSEEQRQRTTKGFQHAVPAMKQFKGYRGMELWTQADGTMLGVSRWESKEALKEYTDSPLFRSHHGGVSGSEAEEGPSGPTYYEVTVIE